MWFSNQIKYLKYSNDYCFIKSIVKYTGTHKAVNKWAFRAEMDSYFELIVYKTREQPKFSPLSVRLQNTHTVAECPNKVFISKYSRVDVHVGI